MPNQPEWLPPLVLFEDQDGNWDRYLHVLYAYFKQDFIDSRPEYKGIRLGFKRYPVVEGKEATFWHVISEGNVEEERLPDLRRCERIRWPRPVIEHADEPVIKIWENERKGEKRINLWLENQEYLVVLAVRKTYILLWTAFPVTKPHRKAALQKEYVAYKKAEAAP